MKKTISIFIIFAVCVTMFCSCNRFKYEDCHPTNYPMSKWEGEGVELYITDPDVCGIDDFMIIDFGEKKLAFNVWWYGNGLWQLEIFDTRIPVSENGTDTAENMRQHSIAFFELKLLNETSCVLETQGMDGLPEGMLPEKIVLNRVAFDLSPEDIPKIEIDENYSFCPTYCYESQWVSDDNRVSISILSQKGAEYGVGEVTFAEKTDQKMYMTFFEYNSTVYLGELTGKYDMTKYIKISDSEEKWQCEYFEDYFVATVICSEYYEIGQRITFTKVK